MIVFCISLPSFPIVCLGETAPSSAQDNSKSSTPADTEEVKKDVKEFEADDLSETGKMIEEERAETGRVRTPKWRLICHFIYYQLSLFGKVVLR